MTTSMKISMEPPTEMFVKAVVQRMKRRWATLHRGKESTHPLQAIFLSTFLKRNINRFWYNSSTSVVK